MWTAPTPALSISRIVLAILKAPPQPVSISTSKGVSVAAVIRTASVITSCIEVIPKSGRPYDAAATPPPERYKHRNPTCSAIKAAYALIAPTICSGCSWVSASRNLLPAVDTAWTSSVTELTQAVFQLSIRRYRLNCWKLIRYRSRSIEEKAFICLFQHTNVVKRITRGQHP